MRVTGRPAEAGQATPLRRLAFLPGVRQRPLPWPVWVAIGLGLAAAGFVLAPNVPSGNRLAAVMAGICPQQPSHSFFLGGVQLPLEARMIGIFGGFLVATAAAWLTGRGLAGGFGRWWVVPLALLLIGTMALDGLNALATDIRLPAPYTPDNTLRLATGLLAGWGLAIVLTPVLAPIAWHRTDTRGLLENVQQLWFPAAGLGALLLAARSGLAVFYWPVAVLAVGGAIALLSVLNAIVLLVVADRDGRLTRGGDLAGWLSLAGGVALLELAALASLRWWAAAALGIRWETL